MFNDLEHMEKELQKMYSCEVEFSQSVNIQKIINYCGFSLIELCKVFKGNITAGPRTGMLLNATTFYNNVFTIGYNIELGIKKMRWVYCEDTRHHPPTLYVLIFPAINELKYYKYLQKADKLKAFI